MTRGRKKDLTIPPTRALTQQRDYRARKAHYVAELEERCRIAEEENVRLRRDLELARASLTVPYLFNPLAIDLSAELTQNITALTTSLGKFQEFAQQHPLPAGPSKGVQLPPIQDCLGSPPPPPPHHRPHSLPLSPIPPPMLRPALHIPDFGPPRGRERLRREDSPSSSSYSNSGDTSSRYELRTSSPESECCGGVFDCTELCEGEANGSQPSPSHTRYLQSDERLPRR
ncbi:hypothetical protein EST38_g2521 [Candolleomyces aberdarensis]|uniref:BZIP domain-containing protein n=1 Tax=Candolleomyces aberdarensis TaxID=2316362 RepID=A0A4Q2DWM0_9AGAR|nr:hypothetical protein EST38_g2521 [Candolleomyces aberdarensis]